MRERIGTRLGLRECDDLTNVFFARKQCNKAIDAERKVGKARLTLMRLGE